VKRYGRSVRVVQEGQKRKLYEIAGNKIKGKEEGEEIVK